MSTPTTPQRNIVLSDKLTETYRSMSFTRDLELAPYVAMKLPTEAWELTPTAFGPESWFGYLLADFRKHRSFEDMSINDVAHVVAQTLVQEEVAIDRGLYVGGGCDFMDYTVCAVVVHEDTTGLSGFWPLVHAIRLEQDRLGLPEAAIYTHSSSHKLQLFTEHPVHESQLSS